MKFNVKTLLGIGIIGAVGFYLWKRSKDSKIMTGTTSDADNLNFMGRKSGSLSGGGRSMGMGSAVKRNINDVTGCSKGGRLIGNNNGYAIYVSDSGQGGWSCKGGDKFSLAQAGLS